MNERNVNIYNLEAGKEGSIKCCKQHSNCFSIIITVSLIRIAHIYIYISVYWADIYLFEMNLKCLKVE